MKCVTAGAGCAAFFVKNPFFHRIKSRLKIFLVIVRITLHYVKCNDFTRDFATFYERVFLIPYFGKKAGKLKSSSRLFSHRFGSEESSRIIAAPASPFRFVSSSIILFAEDDVEWQADTLVFLKDTCTEQDKHMIVIADNRWRPSIEILNSSSKI